MNLLERKANKEARENEEREKKEYKWQEKYKVAHEEWEKAGKPRGWLEP